MKQQLAKLGGQLGVGLCVVGLLLVFLGWNGAASRNFLPAQFPYLISGGITGLCLVVIGVGTIVVQNQRADRAELQKTLEQLIEAVNHAGVSRNGSTGPSAANEFVAGRDSFHRADCRLAQGRDDAEPITVEDAIARGLEPCRVCEPVSAAAEPEAPRRRQLRAR